MEGTNSINDIQPNNPKTNNYLVSNISTNNDIEKELEEEGKPAEATGILLFRRIMGKKLCAITILNQESNKTIGALIHDPEIIPKLVLGNIINVKGKIHFHNNSMNKKNIEVEKVNILGAGIESHKIGDLRQFYIENKKKLSNYDTLCTYTKKGLDCPKKDCKFRHEIKDSEIEIINKNKLRKKIAYENAHEGDPLDKDEKHHKNIRNSEFADFLVDTFGIENLKKGIILDIAGGKGLISYYLTIKYNLKCKIIDPRGATLPKKILKELKNKNIIIEEERKIFNIDSCKEMIKNCSLIIGMHPDEATIDIVDVALKNKINFAVVPCCVFHSKFPERKLKNGKDVIEYTDLIQFIMEKDDNLQIHYLNIKGRNKVIYKKYN